MTITQSEVLQQSEEKEYGFIPDKGCKWGGDSCLNCALPECVFVNPKMKKVSKEIFNMAIMIDGNGKVINLNVVDLQELIEKKKMTELSLIEQVPWYDENGILRGDNANSFTVIPPIPMPNPEPEPEPVPAGVPLINTYYVVEKGRSKYVGWVGTVVSTRVNDKARGGVEVQLVLADGNHKWFNFQSLGSLA